MNTTEKSLTKKDQNTTLAPAETTQLINGVAFKRYVGGSVFRKNNLKEPEKIQEVVEDEKQALQKDASGKLVMTKIETN